MRKNEKASLITKTAIIASCITLLPLVLVFLLFFILSAIESLYGTDLPENL
mgnify:CR=1 FL=1